MTAMVLLAQLPRGSVQTGQVWDVVARYTSRSGGL